MLDVLSLWYNKEGFLDKLGYLNVYRTATDATPTLDQPDYKELDFMSLLVKGEIFTSMGSEDSDWVPKLELYAPPDSEMSLFLDNVCLSVESKFDTSGYCESLPKESVHGRLHREVPEGIAHYTERGELIKVAKRKVTYTSDRVNEYATLSHESMQLQLASPMASWHDTLIEFQVYTQYITKKPSHALPILHNPFDSTGLCAIPSNTIPVVFTDEAAVQYPKTIYFGEKMLSSIYMRLSGSSVESQIIFPREANILQLHIGPSNCFRSLKLPDKCTYFFLDCYARKPLKFPTIHADYVQLNLLTSANGTRVNLDCEVVANRCVEFARLGSASNNGTVYQVNNITAPVVRYNLYFKSNFILSHPEPALHVLFYKYAEYNLSRNSDVARFKSDLICVLCEFSSLPDDEYSVSIRGLDVTDLYIELTYDDSTTLSTVDINISGSNITNLHINGSCSHNLQIDMSSTVENIIEIQTFEFSERI